MFGHAFVAHTGQTTLVSLGKLHVSISRVQQLVERIVARDQAQIGLHIDWQPISMMVIVKVVVLLFGALSYQTLTNEPLPSWSDWLIVWNHWDAPHYLALAEFGYQNSGELRLFLVFYPLFPWLTRLTSIVFGNYLVSAFVVSTIASLMAALLLWHLVLLDQSRTIARRSVWFLAIFPTSYFLHIGYTESLFLAFLLGCLLAARRGHWLLAGLLGAAASLTRVNGLLLLPALMVEAALQYQASRQWQWRWLWIGAVGLGFVAYLGLNFTVTGDPFAFLAIQDQHWYKELTWPWVGIRETIASIKLRTPAEAQMIGVQELLFILLGLVGTLASARYLRPTYTIWMATNWLLITSTKFILSVPRYSLILFPLFILFARLSGRRQWELALTMWSCLFLSLFVSLFVQGKWAF